METGNLYIFIYMKKHQNIFKGGIRLTTKFVAQSIQPIESGKKRSPIDYALQFFISNSSISVFTNSSLSCITLKLILDDIIESPFLSMRSDTLEYPVKMLLLKVFVTSLHTTTNDIFEHMNIPERGKNPDFLVTSFKDLETEINLQKEIYRKSFENPDSMFDAICPAIVGYKKNLDDNELNNITDKLKVVVDDYVAFMHIITSVKSYNQELNKEYSISYIAMELMEGYDTAFNVLSDLEKSINFKNFIKYKERYKFLLKIVTYELVQFHRLGYYHGDAHLNNILINPTAKYFSDTNKQKFGKAILIDFGRTKILDKSLRRYTDINNPIFKKWLNYETFFTIEAKSDYLKQFKDIYEELSKLRKPIFKSKIGAILSYFNNYTRDIRDENLSDIDKLKIVIDNIFEDEEIENTSTEYEEIENVAPKNESQSVPESKSKIKEALKKITKYNLFGGSKTFKNRKNKNPIRRKNSIRRKKSTY